MKKPDISIIIPYKNAAPWFEECLSSISDQSFPYFEVVAVNDHSTDNSEQMLQRFCAADDRFRALTVKGKGIINALETAYAAANGKFITRMDADDVMPEEKLQLMIGQCQKHPNKLVTGKVRYFSENEVSEGYQRYEDWLNNRVEHSDFYDHIYRECPVASPNWMISKHRAEKFELFTNLSYPEDYHMILKCYAAGIGICGIPRTTHLWREHPDRTSRNSAHYDQRAFFDLKIRFFIEHDRNPDKVTAIIGTGKKASLTAGIFNDLSTPFMRFGLQAADGIYHFEQLRNLNAPQVLIAVWPSEQQRKKIVDFLNQAGVEDWWFL